MLGIIASHFTEQLYAHCHLNPSKKAIYKYGFQLCLSSLASACSITVLSILLGDVCSSLLFIGVFYFLRLYTGGYHASTYARCFLLTNAVYLMVYTLSHVLLYLQGEWLLPIITIGSCITIAAFAPIRNTNHPLSETTYKKNKKNAVILVFIESLILLFLFFRENISSNLSVSVMSLAAVAVMMFISIKRREQK